MRVLFTSPAGLGHIHPMVPLARAMAARGHEVMWAAPADGVDHIENAGIRAVATGGAGLTRPSDVRRRFPELDALPPAEMPNVLFGKMFGAVAAPAILADLVPVALEWRPDVVVADAAEFAGHIVAAELGVPSVSKGFGPLLPERRVAAVDAEVAPLWRSRGLEPRPYGGSYDHLYLDIYPPGLRPGGGDHVGARQDLRPVPFDGAADQRLADHIVDDGSERPLVYLTFGTVAATVPAFAAALPVAVRSVAGLPVRVLVTLGQGGDPGALAEVPDNVHVERWVPQAGVLPHASAVVCHGGYGSVLGPLTAGVPLVVSPQFADQPYNAERVAAVGAGVALPLGPPDPDVLREAVGRVLGDARFRSASAAIAEEIRGLPPAGEAVDRFAENARRP